MADLTRVDAADLGVYLDDEDLNSGRAQMLLDLAVTLCQSVTTPLAQAAKAVVLAAASRAYSNPAAANQMGLGSAQLSFGPARANGVYLTKGEKATLLRLAGRAGAFSVDILPPEALAGE